MPFRYRSTNIYRSSQFYASTPFMYESKPFMLACTWFIYECKSLSLLGSIKIPSITTFLSLFSWLLIDSLSVSKTRCYRFVQNRLNWLKITLFFTGLSGWNKWCVLFKWNCSFLVFGLIRMCLIWNLLISYTVVKFECLTHFFIIF